MKQLSLKSINDKAPLEVSLTTSGTFTFGTEKANNLQETGYSRCGLIAMKDISAILFREFQYALTASATMLLY
jgi:hypothetical protein